MYIRRPQSNCLLNHLVDQTYDWGVLICNLGLLYFFLCRKFYQHLIHRIAHAIVTRNRPLQLISRRNSGFDPEASTHT
ncbi:hypothetical protein D3C75_665120 [compost metagenome]